MLSLKPFRQFGIVGVGLVLLSLMSGCAAPIPAAAPIAPTAPVAPTATSEPASPRIQVENVWSQPALLTASVSASTATPCPTPDVSQTVDPCDADGAPTSCATSTGADSPVMATMTDTGTRGVVYLTLTNQGNASDRLIQVESAVATSAGLHRTSMDSAGMMSMRPVENGLEIPAGGQVVLEPGSYHIMLVDLKQDLVLGDHFDVVLIFANSAPITATAEVRLP